MAGEKECWPRLITACLKQEGRTEELELDLKHLDVKITDLGNLHLNSQTATITASSCSKMYYEWLYDLNRGGDIHNA